MYDFDKKLNFDSNFRFQKSSIRLKENGAFPSKMSPTFRIKNFRDNLNKIWTWISRHNSNFDNLNINKHVNYISLTVALGSKTKNRNYPRSQPEKFCHFFCEIFWFAEFFVLDTSEIPVFMFQFKIRVISTFSIVFLLFLIENSYFSSKMTVFNRKSNIFSSKSWSCQAEK